MTPKDRILTKKEEYKLIKNWQTKNDKSSLDQIIRSYRRMAEAYAKKYMKYKIPREDLVSEGIIAIIHALSKFDLKKKLRLSTYASWWIRAAMQDYILKNWSIVKIASTATQKSLFFGLNRMKKNISKNSCSSLSGSELDYIAKLYKVNSKVITNMETRLVSGDYSVDQTYENEKNNDQIIQLVDKSPNQEDIVSAMKDNFSRRKWLYQALNTLNEREKEIVKRKLKDKPLTLENLSKKIGISKERVRQIESKAYQKLNKKILSISGQSKNFFLDNN
jgi:RNA polymerase sigma-32 factor